MEYLNQEVNDFHREDYYWAQIATEVRRSNSSKPQDVKVKDFMIEFTSKEEKKTASSTESSKSYWKQILGIG